MSSEAFAERILSFVRAKGYKPRELRELAEAMGVAEAERGDFHGACKALMKTGRVVLGGRNALMLPPPTNKVVGTYRANQRGFGFVIPDTPNSHGDLFVPPGQASGALTGDTVVARVLKRGKRDGNMLYEGRVVEVVRRGRNRFVGELQERLRRWFVLPDGNTLHVPILVADPGAKRAREGDQVVVEITQYPKEGCEARGVIVKVLGARGEPGVETLCAIEQFQLPVEFSKAALAEASRVVKAFDAEAEAEEREDLRKLTIITIDPDNARDFDDAISLTKGSGATVELGVHIADVAHFVREGGALDREAKDRATSVYLPRMVIPMLPEVLSNGVCSLQEREPRLAKSVFVTYGRGGKVTSVRLANTIIRSAKRLTYGQATAVLEGKRGRLGAKVVALIGEMERLAKAIHRRRLREGMLELDLPAIDLVFDDEGRPVDVAPSDAGYAHKIIEMFMVEANEAVARELNRKKVPFLRRVHDQPRELATANLGRFLTALGHPLPPDADRFAVQKLLDKVRGKSDGFAVHLAVLRSMQQAEYAPVNMGHFALASRQYGHFTSPIRRYPDLTIHRLVDRGLRGEFDKRGRRSRTTFDADLVALGDHCSTNARRAESAEREAKLVLLLQLLKDRHVGATFGGIVTGVANVGVFVQLERFLVDGLLRFDQLPDDWWEVDAARGCVVGERSGRTITVGDRVKVVIAKVSIATRQLDLGLAEPMRPVKSKKHGRGDAANAVAPQRGAGGTRGRGRRGRGRPAATAQGASTTPRRRKPNTGRRLKRRR